MQKRAAIVDFRRNTLCASDTSPGTGRRSPRRSLEPILGQGPWGARGRNQALVLTGAGVPATRGALGSCTAGL